MSPIAAVVKDLRVTRGPAAEPMVLRPLRRTLHRHTGIFQGGENLADQLHHAWGSFVVGNPPTASGVPDWPADNLHHRPTMIFDPSGTHPIDDPRPVERAAWDGRDWNSTTWWNLDGDSVDSGGSSKQRP